MILFYADGRLGNQLFQLAFLRFMARGGERIICANMAMLFKTLVVKSPGVIHVDNRIARWIFRVLLATRILPLLAYLRIFGGVAQCKTPDKVPLPGFVSHRGLFPITFVAVDFFQSQELMDETTFLSELEIRDDHQHLASSFLSRIPTHATKVFVHVRRGDYVDEVFRGVRGVELPDSYYRSAIALARARLADPYFVFVTDDPVYVNDRFSDVTPSIVSNCAMGVDLAIMAQCTSGIVSNSSFSWWGSALMKERMLVIAPKYWFGWRLRMEYPVGIIPSFASIIDPHCETAHSPGEAA